MLAASQLYALGLSKDQVRARVGTGWLTRIHRGVYLVGPTITEAGRWMAAVLAVGAGAVLSHAPAGRLWRILPASVGEGNQMTVSSGPATGRVVDVTVTADRGSASRAGVMVHRSRTLFPSEVTRHRRIPVTTPARTLLDLAVGLGRRALERAVDEAERLGLADEKQLVETVSSHRADPGAGKLGRVLRTHAVGSTLTRSELEERFLSLCRARGLPQPAVNASLVGLTVDFLWPEPRVVVEVDGRGSHDTRRAFQDDRDRDSLLAVNGYLTLRFTWWDVVRRPRLVSHRVSAVLRARGAPSRRARR